MCALSRMPAKVRPELPAYSCNQLAQITSGCVMQSTDCKVVSAAKYTQYYICHCFSGIEVSRHQDYLSLSNSNFL